MRFRDRMTEKYLCGLLYHRPVFEHSYLVVILLWRLKRKPPKLQTANNIKEHKSNRLAAIFPNCIFNIVERNIMLTSQCH